MRNLKFIHLSLLAAALGFATACTEETVPGGEDVSLSITPDTLSFTSMPGQDTVLVKSAVAWTASLDTTVVKWCQYEQKGDTLFVSVNQNESLTENRSANIVVSNGKNTRSVLVKQEKAEEANLILRGTNVEIECEGLVPSVLEYMTNVLPVTVAWPDGEKPEWVNEPTILKDSLIFTASDNPTKQSRSVEVEIIAGPEGNQVKKTVTLTQKENAPYLKLSQDTVRLDYKGTPVNLDVYFNATIDDNDLLLKGSWINPADYFYKADLVEEVSLVRSQSMKAKKRIYKIWADPNPATTERVVDRGVYATLDGNTSDEIFLMKYVVILQEGAPVASVTAPVSSVLFDVKGGTQTIDLTANYDALQATASEGWITVSLEGKKLTVATAQTTDSKDRKGVVTVICGSGSNQAVLTLEIIQAGTSSPLVLSTNSVNLSAAGTEQVVKVATSLSDWFVEGAPTWLHVDADVAKGEIRLSADKAEATRTAALKVMAGDGSTSVNLDVVQTKQYKIGEVYMVEGKPVGIVFHVTDGGNHGYVFSLDDSKLSEDPNNAYHWSLGMYARLLEDDPAFKEASVPTAVDKFDGRNNMAAIMACTNPLMAGRTWQECYPAMAWGYEYAKNNPGQEWYIPSYDELYKLVAYLNGVYEGSGITGTAADAQKRAEARDKVNALLKENGGTEFVWDYVVGISPNASRLTSSTEIPRTESLNGFVSVYTMQPLHFSTENELLFCSQTHAGGDKGDLQDASITSIRMMFRF